MDTDYKTKVTNKLRMLYFISMSTILLVAMVIYLITSYNISRKSGISEIINIAGSQRMLSQRVVLYLSLYEKTGQPDHKSTIEEAMKLMSIQHESLTNPPGLLNLKNINTNDLANLYAERGLGDRIHRFLAVSERALNTTDTIERTRLIRGLGIEVKERLLDELDEAVSLYAAISTERIEDLNQIVNSFILIVVITVFGNILFVYRPINTEIKRMIDQLHNLATLDPLTGVLNRRSINKHLNAQHQLFERYERLYSVCLIDIDNFKSINDQWGHDAGDKALVHFCKIVQSHLRQCDFFARYGGEEFIILLPETNIQECVNVGEKIRRKIEKSILEVENNILIFTVSIGCATIQKGMTTSDLIKLADKNVYTAKRSGRNRVIYE